MKIKFTFLIAIFIIATACKENKKNEAENKPVKQEIPIELLAMDLKDNQQEFSKVVLENEIPGINVEHLTLGGNQTKEEKTEEGIRTIYLFITGEGKVVANDSSYQIVPETILVPNSIESVSIKTAINDTLNFLKITTKLTEQDLLDLETFPDENTQQIYFKKFTDCEAYTEPIKSPNTVSRTILPNKYLPRIAMGTVQTKGPDKVGAHEHGMLEQLFLGLTDNQVIVYADSAQVDFPEYSILHIPLGSSHSVEAKSGEVMYYVWMDFFRDKAGEEWLKTHNTIKEE